MTVMIRQPYSRLQAWLSPEAVLDGDDPPTHKDRCPDCGELSLYVGAVEDDDRCLLRCARHDLSRNHQHTFARFGLRETDIIRLKQTARRTLEPPLPKTRVCSRSTSDTLPSTATEPVDLSDADKLDRDMAGNHLTDLGNAERLVARHGQDLRYCQAWRCWLVWDGMCWRRDETGEVMRRAIATVRGLYREAAACDNAEERKVLSAWAKRSEAKDRLAAMVFLAQIDPGIAVKTEDMDADPWLLNVANGTLDLRTGQLRPQDRADLITKIAPVIFDPTATNPTFNRFLSRVLPDPEVRAFLQCASGWSLTGDVSEQCLFFLHGSGANGKSTFINALRDVLGDYGTQAAPDLLVAKQNAHPTEQADLLGKRFVATIEVEDGKRLAEGLVKQMTGGDRMKARYMRQDFFEFTPTFKIFFAANHRPIVRGTDWAIWRRIKMVPFTETIRDDEKDLHLGEKLRAEASGILNWMLAGCLAWQQGGLKEPEAIQTATADYREDMDLIGQFLEQCCLVAPNVKVATKDLYAAYCDWCEANGERAFSSKRLGTTLTERGFQRCKGFGPTNAHGWRGVGLLADPTDPSPGGGGTCEAPRRTQQEGGRTHSDPSNEKGADPLTPISGSPQENSLAKTVMVKEGSNGSNGSPPVSAEAAPLLLNASSVQVETVQNLAKRRTQGHDHCRRSDQDRGGAAANGKADFYGLLFETILYEAMEQAGIEFHRAPLVADRAPSGPDFSIGSTSFDAKAAMPGGSDLYINVAQHHDPDRRADFYLLGAFDTETSARLYLVPHAAVDCWKKVETVRRPFYTCPRSQLTPLTDVAELTRLSDPDKGTKWRRRVA